MSGKDNTALVDETGRVSLDPKHAPIPLPAGSYDIDALKKGLNEAARASAENRDGKIAEALNAAKAEDTKLEAVDTAAQPGHVEVEVENKELGITEKLRVFSEKKSDEVVAAAEPADTKE